MGEIFLKLKKHLKVFIDKHKRGAFKNYFKF